MESADTGNEVPHNTLTRQFSDAFQKRAQLLKTRLHGQKQDLVHTQYQIKSGGLSRAQYWEQRVKTKEDAEEYYKIYHPEYPEFLVKALVNKIDDVIVKYNTTGDLDHIEHKILKCSEHLDPREHDVVWNPAEDIKEEFQKARINMTISALDSLNLNGGADEETLITT